MFKLGSYLLFITFSQLITVILYTESLPGVGVKFDMDNIHPLVKLIIFVELIFAGFLMYKGYSKFDKLD